MANEKRLIDANKLIEHKFQLAPARYRMGWNDAIDAVIENAPTIDAVVLPCKIGEKVFCINRSKNEIVEDVVEDYDIWSIKTGVKLRLSLLNHKDYIVGEFGETVFLTREEAEVAFAKMDGDSNG